MNDCNVFPEQTYVVLLSTCKEGEESWGSGIPTSYVYQLSKPSSSINFFISKDLCGSFDNGWSVESYERAKKYDCDKLRLRLATPNEIAKYLANNGPVKAENILEYQIY